jgi:hypothetical protein
MSSCLGLGVYGGLDEGHPMIKESGREFTLTTL